MSDRKTSSPEGIEYKIQFGEIHGARYIGVQPPLPPNELMHFRSAVEDVLENDYCFVTRGFTRRPEKGSPYTEFGVIGSPDVEMLKDAASDAMETVKHSSDSYRISGKMRGIGWGKYLFGGKDVIRPAR
jgi:hypothetical protein